MSENLYDANSQWANRPADQRFWNLDDMRNRCAGWRKAARTVPVDLTKIRLKATGPKTMIVKGENSRVGLTHFSFGQLANLVHAPAGYLRELPADLAALCINSGLEHREADGVETVMLIDKEEKRMRAVTSGTYGRIWNDDVIRHIQPLTANGWRVPPARPSGEGDTMARSATEADCLQNRMAGIGIKPGDMIAPAGLYASDKDMFAFLVNENKTIKAGNRDLCRGFFVENSEVGDCAFKLTTFLYSSVCGNHICWDVSQVQRSKVVHKGEAAPDRAFDNLRREMAIYADSSALEIENRIGRAQRLELGKNKEEVVLELYGKRLAPKAQLENAFDEAVKHPEDGHVSPRSVWGMVQGMTRLSQQSRFADTRVGMDRTATKILALAN